MPMNLKYFRILKLCIDHSMVLMLLQEKIRMNNNENL